jgi:spore maturation protein CgeB
MKCVLFLHAFTSCWNNGHAHFMRGVARELVDLGHQVVVYEVEDGWSRRNALADGGAGALAEAEHLIPDVEIRRYVPERLDLDRALDHADLVVVHEWSEPALISALGRRRERSRFRLLFHDAHHRAITAPDDIRALDLRSYDGALLFGEVLREAYLRHGWAARAFTWHEAADTALFHPMDGVAKERDLVWIGNWGDGERSRELREFLIKPVAQLGLDARVHGVRYPDEAKNLLRNAGIDYAGWLPNHRAPDAFARARATVHIPRGPYSAALRGIPTIRVFEALACGIPLVCAPWSDDEHLFPDGVYLRAANGDGMVAALRTVLNDRDLAAALSKKGLDAIRRAHTCRHRAEELLRIVASLSQPAVRQSAPREMEAAP